MNTGKGILLKLISAVVFAMMSALVRYLGVRYPVGEVVFYRSAFAMVPVMLVYAWRGELRRWCVPSGRRPGRPRRHQHRGHVLQFRRDGAAAAGGIKRHLVHLAAVQRGDGRFDPQGARTHLPLVAVVVGFIGVLVVLSPHLSGDELTVAMASATSLAGILYGITGSFCNAAP